MHPSFYVAWGFASTVQQTMSLALDLRKENASASLLRRAGRIAGRLALDARLIAVLDQVFVSAAGFLAIVLIGNSEGAAELGRYSFAISFISIVIAAQNSLVLVPFAIRRNKAGPTPAPHLGGALAVTGTASIVMAVVTGCAALPMARALGEPGQIWFFLALALLIPFALLREFARQIAFAELDAARALWLDVSAVALQFASLFVLASLHALSATTACLSLACASAMSPLFWISHVRRRLEGGLRAARRACRESWTLGRWTFLWQLTVQVQSYISYWVCLMIGGAALGGLYAACISIVAFSNPLIFGFGNVLVPRLAQSLAHGGLSGLRRESLKNAALLGGAMTVFCILLLAFGDLAMGAMFRDPAYAGHGYVVAILGAALIGTAVGLPAANGLLCLERFRLVVGIGFAAIAFTFPLTLALVRTFGFDGAAWSFLAGNTILCAGRWIGLFAATANPLVAAEQPDARDARIGYPLRG